MTCETCGHYCQLLDAPWSGECRLSALTMDKSEADGFEDWPMKARLADGCDDHTGATDD